LAPKYYKAETKLQSQTFQLCNFWNQNIGKKSTRKMLMKLTLTFLMEIEMSEAWTWKNCS